MKRTEIVQHMNNLLEEKSKSMFSPEAMKSRFKTNKKNYTNKLASNGDYELVGDRDGAIALTKNGKLVELGDFDRGADAFFINLPKARKPAFDEAQDVVDHAAAVNAQPL